MDNANAPRPPDSAPNDATAAAATASTSMSEPQTAHPGTVVDETFLSTGRTGRRNALGDILDANTAFLSTADLPDQMSALSFGSDQCAPSTSSGASMYPSTSSSSTNSGASTSHQQQQ